MVVERAITVRAGEARVGNASAHFICEGLGSGVAVAVLDPVAGIAGCASVVIPKHCHHGPEVGPAAFAEDAIVELVSQAEQSGAQRARLVAALAGAAEALEFDKGYSCLLNLGPRNLEGLAAALRRLEIPMIACDGGGTEGRKVVFDVPSGEFRVTTNSKGERLICNLRNKTA